MNLNQTERGYDVAALGELLIDFTENGRSSQGNPLFECNPGGAPCNVLAMLEKLGKKTAFIGKVGDDMFGHLLKERVTGEGIDLSGLVMSRDVRTTLAFVQNGPEGDREFSFYRNPGADMSLKETEVNTGLIEHSKIFHFGSLSMTHKEVEQATVKALNTAKKSGCLISYDPNLRERLWDSLKKAEEKIRYGIANCDILKIADNEITFLTGKENPEEGMEILLKQYHPKIAFATLGKEGSIAYYRGMKVYEPAVLNENTADTTGAGDTFTGCALNFLLEHDINRLTKENLRELLRFANAAASIVTTRKGALCVMPEKDEILKLM